MTSYWSITQTQEPNHSRFPANPNWEVMISLEYLTLAPYHNTLPWLYPVLCTFLYYHYFTVIANFSGNKTHSEPDMKFNSFCFFSMWSYDLPLLCLAGQATDNSFLVFVSILTLSSCNSGTAAIKDLMERCLPKSSLHNRTDKLTCSQACLPTDKQVRGHNSTISWDDITDKCVFHTHHIFHSLC